jgi:hypothetical protein
VSGQLSRACPVIPTIVKVPTVLSFGFDFTVFPVIPPRFFQVSWILDDGMHPMIFHLSNLCIYFLFHRPHIHHTLLLQFGPFLGEVPTLLRLGLYFSQFSQLFTGCLF